MAAAESRRKGPWETYHEASTQDGHESTGQRVKDEGAHSQSDEEDGGVDRTVAVGLQLEGQEVGARLADRIRIHRQHEGEVKGGGMEKMRCNDPVGGPTLVEDEQGEEDHRDDQWGHNSRTSPSFCIRGRERVGEEQDSRHTQRNAQRIKAGDNPLDDCS
ncbi:hypothetical protein APSETT444_009883 [Aspergillus pseudonomiae]